MSFKTFSTAQDALRNVKPGGAPKDSAPASKPIATPTKPTNDKPTKTP